MIWLWFEGFFLNYYLVWEHLQMSCMGMFVFTFCSGWCKICTVSLTSSGKACFSLQVCVGELTNWLLNRTKWMSSSDFSSSLLVSMLQHVLLCDLWLYHTLSDLTCFCRLDEGQYLIAHKAGEPFVTLLKASTGKVSRGAYNLQQVHSSVPQPPASGHVPWIPVDPAVVLPFHWEHSRVPCTFPPKPFLKVCTSFMWP